MAKHDQKTMSKLVYYDKENDILAIHKGFSSDEKFKGNIDIGDLIVDVSTKGRIRGIEVVNATKFFREFADATELNALKDAEFNATVNPNSMTLGIVLKSEKRQIPAKIAIPIKSTKF